MIPDAAVFRTVLANGLTVLVRRDTSAPVAAVVTYVRAGYFDETDDVVGIAHVLEHMFFKGTPSRGVGEIARETKASGGYLNAHTIYDHTSYYAVLPREGFERGLEVQADAYARSLIDADELARELEVIIQEAKRKADSPSAVAVETLFELLHDRHRIRRWRIGREPGLRALRREHLLSFYRNFYRPSNTILVVVGDISPDQTLRRVEELYGALEPGEPTRRPGAAETAPPGFRYRELQGDIARTEVVFGWRTPGSLAPETPALDVAAGILGDGRGSRLYRAVRERQLATSVAATNYTPTEIGVFDMHLQAPPERGRAAAAAAWAELRALADHGPAGAEVERVQRMFEARWLRRLETMEGQASFLAEWEALGDWRLSAEYFGRVMGLKPADVQTAAARHLPADQVSLLVYRPRSAEPFAADPVEVRRVLASAAAQPGIEPEAAVRGNGRMPARTRVALDRRAGAVSVFRTSEGLPILVRRRHGTPLVHLGVFSAAGAAREPAPAAGVTTLMARAVLKGTERRSAADIAYAAERLGGSIAPNVASESTSWVFAVPAGRTREAIDLLGDVVQRPRFDAEAVETERSIALAQLVQMRDDMLRYPIRLATAAAFGAHPYARAPLGAEETLAGVTADDVRVAHAAVRSGAPAVVAAVGDLDELALARLLASAFDEVRDVGVSALERPVWPSGPAVSAETRDKAQTGLAVLFPGPDRHDPRRFTAHLTAGIASGLGGRFFEALREKRSLAYTVMAQAIQRDRAGVFLAYIATSPEREEEARRGLLEQFALLREQEVTEEELTRAKVYAIGTHAIGLQSGSAVLGEMVDAWLHGTGLGELDEFDSRVRAVTAAQIRELAADYFDPAHRAEGIVRGLASQAPTPSVASR